MDSDHPTREQLEQRIAELIASRDRFRDMVERTSDWVWEVDRNARYSYVSPRVRDLLGREPADLIGITPFDIMPPDEAERVGEIFADIAAYRESFARIENICLHADGRELVMETSGVPIFGPDGEFVGYRGVDRDITERKQNEISLRLEKDFSTTLIQASPAFIVAIDPAGKTLLMNESMRRELGYTQDQGAVFTILLPLSDADDRANERSVASHEPVKGTGRILVVDDEQSVRDFIQTSMQNLGYTVTTCAEGAEGVEYFREHHREIDLVILDLIMPKMSGQDAFGKMKEIDPNVRVLVSSGFIRTQATGQMLDEGARELLSKPFKIAELSEAVARHIRRDSHQ